MYDKRSWLKEKSEQQYCRGITIHTPLDVLIKCLRVYFFHFSVHLLLVSIKIMFYVCGACSLYKECVSPTYTHGESLQKQMLLLI